MKWIFVLIFFILNSVSAAQQLNVYVKYDDALLKKNIKVFNQFLDKQGIFKKYPAQSFLERYPLHTTLYLAEYKPDTIASVISTVRAVSQHWAAFEITSANIFLSQSNYLMMNVLSKPQNGHINPILQEYSDAMVMALHQLRDRGADIPEWAKNNPAKYAAYQRYGSPNVFFEYTPHFSLMAKPLGSAEIDAQFQAEMTGLIRRYAQKHPHQTIKLRATDIGIGYVNGFGQVTEEILRIRLK